LKHYVSIFNNYGINFAKKLCTANHFIFFGHNYPLLLLVFAPLSFCHDNTPCSTL
jgi:hypothetical protein